MTTMPRIKHIAVLLASSALVACATSPLGRSQLKLFDPGTMANMGSAAFTQIESQSRSTNDPAERQLVGCIAERILSPIGENPSAWEVEVFAGDDRNAFALPGRKIGVYSGMIDFAGSEAELAAVVAHEIAHVLAEHGNERMSTAFAANAGLEIAGAIATASNEPRAQTAMALLGLGAQIGVVLPFSRAQETEADLLGLELMARAGFDPADSVDLWQRMGAESRSAPPEFLSTHPAPGSRMRRLQAALPQVQPLYEAAGGDSGTPRCAR